MADPLGGNVLTTKLTVGNRQCSEKVRNGVSASLPALVEAGRSDPGEIR
jgi:hypothetical protein